MMIKKEKAPEGAKSKQHLDNSTEARILQVLKGGATSRARLVKLTGVSDRRVRKSIEEMRNRGIPIVSSSRLGGYWLGTRADCLKLAMEYRSRATKMMLTANRLERQLDGQIEMEELNVLLQ